MLQPLQLEQVNSRYASHIADLRDFLVKAGLPVGTHASLEEVAARLRTDSAFHRDLTAHVWLLLEENDLQAGISAILGMLAIAAAGIQFASIPSEAETLYLLRFLMQARRSFEASGDEQHLPAGAGIYRALFDVDAVGSAAEQARSTSQDRAFPALIQQPSTKHGRQSEVQKKNSSARWLFGGAVTAAFLLTGAFLHRRNPAQQNAPVITTPSDPFSQSPRIAAHKATITPDTAEPATTATPTFPIARNGQSHLATPALTVTQHANFIGTGAKPSTVPPSEPLEAHASVPPSPAYGTALSTPASVAPLAVHSIARPSVPAPIPVDLLSRRLGARTLPRYVPDSEYGTDNAPKYPRLLRRSPAIHSETTELLASMHPADADAIDSSINTGRPVQGGVVHPTSLGTMAANILYSPAPTYPVAASAAHVQGQVKVQAQVDRDGNVSYARVVSGPPLLREAALDAVQHWRYRPYVSGGKPIPASATAVVDFELP